MSATSGVSQFHVVLMLVLSSAEKPVRLRTLQNITEGLFKRTKLTSSPNIRSNSRIVKIPSSTLSIMTNGRGLLLRSSSNTALSPVCFTIYFVLRKNPFELVITVMQKSKPLIHVARTQLKLPKLADASQIFQFYQENRYHFAPWSHTYREDFFTENYWRKTNRRGYLRL